MTDALVGPYDRHRVKFGWTKKLKEARDKVIKAARDRADTGTLIALAKDAGAMIDLVRESKTGQFTEDLRDAILYAIKAENNPDPDIRFDQRQKSSAKFKTIRGKLRGSQGYLNKQKQSRNLGPDVLHFINALLVDIEDLDQMVVRALDRFKAEPPQMNEFATKCRPDIWSFQLDDATAIDFLALKKVLNNVVENQEKAVYVGAPDLTLGSLTLTSAFQLTLEASAGTNHFFRIVPVLAPPQTDIKFDHTHTLKVVLYGKKNKGDRLLAKKLADSCRERLGRGQAGQAGKSGKDYCDSDAGKLLESIVQAVEKGGSGSAGQ